MTDDCIHFKKYLIVVKNMVTNNSKTTTVVLTLYFASRMLLLTTLMFVNPLQATVFIVAQETYDDNVFSTLDTQYFQLNL